MDVETKQQRARVLMALAVELFGVEETARGLAWALSDREHEPATEWAAKLGPQLRVALLRTIEAEEARL